MHSLKGQIALITGASAGIGEAIAHSFAEHGANLVLAARRKDRLEALAVELESRYGIAVHTLALDVRRREPVEAALQGLPTHFAAISLLVNNAGLGRGLDKLQDGNPDEWDEMLDTNVKGLLYVTRAVIPGMLQRDRGHVVNLGSVAGHEVYPGGNVYCATKHAVRALTQSLRIDLVGSPIRVSSIDPGMVETEFSVVRFRGDQARANKVYDNMTPLTPADIADAVLYCVTRPAHMDVAEMILMPTQQASATVVDRSGKR